MPQLKDLLLQRDDSPVDFDVLQEAALCYPTPQVQQNCTQALDTNTLAFWCFTCQKADNSCYCYECFVHGGHEGHLWMAHRFDSGQCDCFSQNSLNIGCEKHTMGVPPWIDYRLLGEERLERVIKELVKYLKRIDAGITEDGWEGEGEEWYERGYEIISANPMLLQLCAISSLVAGEEVELSQYCHWLLENDHRKFLFMETPYGGAGCLLLNMMKCKSKCEEKFYYNLFPSDYLFRSGSVRIVAAHASLLVEEQNACLMNTFLQAMMESDSYVSAFQCVDAYVRVIYEAMRASKVPQHTLLLLDQQFQDFNFLQPAQCWHSILHSSSHVLELLTRLQEMALDHKCDPNHMYKNGTEITKPLSLQLQFFEAFFYRNLWGQFLSINRNFPAEMAPETDHTHIVQQISGCIKVLTETRKTKKDYMYRLYPPALVPQLVYDTAVQFNVPLDTILVEISQNIAAQWDINIDRDGLISLLLADVVLQNFWGLYVELNLEYKMNQIDFVGFMEFMGRNLILSLPKMRSYEVVAEFLVQFPQQVTAIIFQCLETFNPELRDLLLFNYICILNYQPYVGYSNDVATRLLAQIATCDNESIEMIMNGQKFFEKRVIGEQIQQLFRPECNLEFLGSARLINSRPDLFDPVLNIGGLDAKLNEFSQASNKFFVPECVTSRLPGRGLLTLARLDVQRLARSTIQKYNNQSVGLGQCMLAVRCLLSLGVDLTGAEFRNAELQNALFPQPIQSASGQKQTAAQRFQKLKVQMGQRATDAQATLMIQDSVPDADLDTAEHLLTCVVCHAPIDGQFIVPATAYTLPTAEHETAHNFCPHAYHQQCAAGLARCTICQHSFSSTLSLGPDTDVSQLLPIYYKMLDLALRLPNSGTAVAQRIRSLLSRVRFLREHGAQHIDPSQLEAELIQLDSCGRLEDGFVYSGAGDFIIDPASIPLNTIQIYKDLEKPLCEKCNSVMEKAAPSVVKCLHCNKFYHFGCICENNTVRCPSCVRDVFLHTQTFQVFRSSSQFFTLPYRTPFGLVASGTEGYVAAIHPEQIALLSFRLLENDCSLPTAAVHAAREVGFTNVQRPRVILLAERLGIDTANMSERQLQWLERTLETMNEDQLRELQQAAGETSSEMSEEMMEAYSGSDE